MPITEKYNKNETIPQIKKKGECVTITHAHASSYSFQFADAKKLQFSERGECRAFFNEGIKEIRRCLSFFEEYQKGSLPIEEKAAIKIIMQKDKDLIEVLENVKPSRCVIL